MATLRNINLRGRNSGCFLLILFYMIIVVPTLIITLHAEVCNAQNLYCNVVTYSRGSDFESNLNTVVNSLAQDTRYTGFNISVYGQSPNRVYGLLQCRGDVTPDECSDCSLDATSAIRQSHGCGNAIGGRIWLELCYLRYENYTFIGQLDTLGYYNYKTYNVSNPVVFNEALQRLLSNLSEQIAYQLPSGSRSFAPGERLDSYPKIYALVQCTRDISTADCSSCLLKAASDIQANYYGNAGVEYVMGSCIVSYETYSFFNSPSPSEAPAYPRQAPSPVATAANTRPAPSPVATTANTRPVFTSSSNSKHSNKIPIITGVVAGGLLLALLICLFITRRRLTGYKVNEQVEAQTLVSEDCQILHEQAEEDLLVTGDRQILTFKMETLIAATNNFHDDNKLGEGGFGPVYKATTHDGKEIAVKKLSINSKQGKKEFLTEVKLVAKIQHRNLVKLLGCCAQGTERLLVYEYLPNSSLDKILFDPIKRKMLDWQKRYNIILGVVRGLLYLHQDSQPRIIHRDIKASNILLDENLNPKIADFGLAKLLPQDESCVSTLTKVAGTLGYMAPEYAMHGQLSAKADVYSFGILLMELVTGRKNMNYNLPPEMQILLGWAWRSYEAGNSVEIIDPVAIIESGDQEQALKCIQVAIWCTQADPSLRPTMFTVCSMLSSHSVTVPYLTKPVCANSVPRFNTRNSGSGYGLSHHSSATTSSTLSDPVPASSSNATVATIELVPR